MMFNSQFADFYAVLTVLGVVVVLWVVISKWRMPAADNAHLLSVSQENLTGISAFLLAGSSVALSIGFAIVLSFHPILTVVFVAMFSGFALVEFISSFHLSRAWNQRRIGGVFFSIWMMIGGVAISILAGQSLLQIAESNAKAERLKQNQEYEAFLARKEYANQRVQELAITDSEVQAAKTALATLLPERERVQTTLDNCPKNYLTLCIKPNTAKLEAIDEKIAAQNAVIKRGNDYQAARQVANELNSTPIEAVPGANESSPGIEALALVLRSEAKVVGAYIFLALAIFCELSALIAFYLWGQSRFERSLPIEERVYNAYTHNVYNHTTTSTHNVLKEPNQKPQEPLKTPKTTSTHNVYTDVQKPSQEPAEPIETQNDDTHNALTDTEEKPQNDTLMSIFEKVKTDIQAGKMENPSFKQLQNTYSVTQKQAGAIRDMLLKAKLAVKDRTGKLVPVR